MDATSLITALIVTGIFLLIFLLPTLSTKKTQKRLNLKLNEMALEHNAKATQSVILGDAIIGLDEKNAMVLFHKQVKDIETNKFVELSEIKSCKLLSQTKSAKSTNENYNQFEKIGLQFINKDKIKPDVYFEVFNNEDNSHLNFDMKLLEQWGVMLNAILK